MYLKIFIINKCVCTCLPVSRLRSVLCSVPAQCTFSSCVCPLAFAHSSAETVPSLPVGSHIDLTLTASNGFGSSNSTVIFFANAPPSGGTCAITPPHGTTTTPFTVSCIDWHAVSTVASNLTYSFSFAADARNVSASVLAPLLQGGAFVGAASDANRVSVVSALPASSSPSQLSAVLVNITDYYGLAVVTQVLVNVTQVSVICLHV